MPVLVEDPTQIVAMSTSVRAGSIVMGDMKVTLPAGGDAV